MRALEDFCLPEDERGPEVLPDGAAAGSSDLATSAGDSTTLMDLEGILGAALGMITARRDGTILHRMGLLAKWAPVPGGDIFQTPVFFGLRDHIESVVIEGRTYFYLNDVTVHVSSGRRPVDIETHWDSIAGLLRITVYDASGRNAGIAEREQSVRVVWMLRETIAGMRSMIENYRKRLRVAMDANPEASYTSAVQRLWKFENFADELQGKLDARLQSNQKSVWPPSTP